jgi:hypothetical protein
MEIDCELMHSGEIFFFDLAVYLASWPFIASYPAGLLFGIIRLPDFCLAE